MKLRNKDKVRVFDFIMTTNTWEFIYQVIRLEIFGSFSRSFENKISKWNNENRSKNKIHKT